MPRQQLRIAVITVSDRTAAGRREDLSGPLAVRLLGEYGEVSGPIVVADGITPVRDMITHAIFCGAPAHLMAPDGTVNTAVPDRRFRMKSQVRGARSKR